MPPFRFCSAQAMNYTGLRDEHDVHLGHMEPGDVRDLDEAPDQWWVPAEGQDDDRDGDKSAGEEDGGSGTPEGSAPDPEPDPSAPVPAPPAVIANP